jgi:hypothetical protein
MWRWLGALAAALLGAAVPAAVFGPGRLLDTGDQGWLLAGPLGPDPVQLWLGWTYFRCAPWALPPGANPDYGLELGSSIYFADAVPLLALALKALRGALDVPQYVGPWLLGCGALHGLLAWRLLGLAAHDPLARACGAGLLALQPMLVDRMAGHTPLAGQWTVLAALWLALLPGAGCGPRGAARRGAAWSALLAATALVHSYLLAMAAPIWAADWLRRALWAPGAAGRAGPRAAAAAALEAAAVPGAVLAALWAGGFFLLRGGGQGGPGSDVGGYGTWSFDLLAYLDGGLWSAFLPDLPDAGHWEAGSFYLGLGGLLLLAAGALACAVRPLRPPRRLWPLAAALLLLLAFAVTHRVTLAGRVWTPFEPPAPALAALGALRNSGRMAWPLAYAAMLGAAAACARAWGGRRTGLLLLALLAAQWADLRPGMAFRRGLVAGAPRGVPERLFDPFWAEAAGAYARVRAAPAANMGEGWESIARFAARAGLPTDSVYLARVDGAAVSALRARVAAALRSGDYEPGTLYVLRDAETLALARASHDPARGDRILRADGYWVLAPGPGAREAAAR